VDNFVDRYQLNRPVTRNINDSTEMPAKKAGGELLKNQVLTIAIGFVAGAITQHIAKASVLCISQALGKDFAERVS
jgi:hypothetical protein